MGKLSAKTLLTAPAADDRLFIYDNSSPAATKAIKLSDIVLASSFGTAPALEGQTTPGTATHTTATGTSLRFGDIVFITLNVTCSDKTGIAGNLQISNLPYAASGNWALNVHSVSGYTLTANHALIVKIVGGDSHIEIAETDGAATSALTDAELSATSSLIVSGFYRTTDTY